MPEPRTTPPAQVPVNLFTRSFYVFALLWGGLCTAFCATGYLVSRRFRPTPDVFAWWARAWGRSMFGVLGVRVVCEGFERVDPARPCVFAANHQNALDIPVAAIALRRPFGYVAKAELETAPFLGAALRSSPSVFVDSRDARRSVESLRRAGRTIREGTSVLVFPEGARSYDGRLGPFRRGAFQLALEAGVNLVPVTIVDAVSVFNETRWAARPGVIRVVVGEPVALDGVDRRRLSEILSLVRERVAAPLPAEWRGDEPADEPRPAIPAPGDRNRVEPLP